MTGSNKTFNLPYVQFKVIVPNELPNTYRVAFEQFLAGSSAAHPVYSYQYDYERFILLIEQGRIKLSYMK
ncbi:hypothetical protein CGI33_21695 [Vibrio parahaemolyticus]|nr:hypothetical protein CGJ20_18590 [Vibrio parahaemolyticus]TOJ64728.1 hypothetical protein CGI34_18800 [Vibrio parahaemolyticus]TOJ73478.1 hypothetical protein CGI33_21695 [Vibrio parahaemolyticus]TOK19087.1 hypothetical protein CGI23_23145 [Vibrio parahaemolyticus]TON23888.1 hypothetical protein CGH60_22050 [Vibrio parahaemolyticus]